MTEQEQAVITAAARAVWAADRYNQCLGEFDGDPEPCVEWDGEYADAMVALDQALTDAGVDWRDPACRVRRERAHR